MDSTTVSPVLCAPSTFDYPSVFGVEFSSIEASLVENFSTYVSDLYHNHNPELWVEDATFCNVTLSYTHPGVGDLVVVESWLPIPWNGRFQALGGGGWSGGRTEEAMVGMAGAMGSDAAITTDAGLGHQELPLDWALLSPGNVNLQALDNLGSKSLDEQVGREERMCSVMAIIGKHLIQSFYGQQPRYSYFNGCSQGGRQGLQLAQRYPEHYDGIAAAAPGIYWSQFFQAMLWTQVVMNEMGEYPYPCELDYLQNAVIEKCDAEDGLEDGIIMDPHSCDFDPFSLVGITFNCHDTGNDMQLSRVAATVAHAFHDGVRAPDGEHLWHGPHWGSNLTMTIFGTPGMAATDCSTGSCVGLPFGYGLLWVSLFALKDPEWNFQNMTREEYSRVFRLAAHEYSSIYGTDDPNLDLFRDAGGKIISFHGLLDDICPTGGTEQYYKEVWERDENVHDFFRYFEVPGVGHCAGGPGGHPNQVFAALRAWVENGTAPDSIPIDVPRLPPSQTRVICPYPQKVQVDPENPERFYCAGPSGCSPRDS
ncbi:hypothetical protein S40288_08561 [Stachybotrys chartarum IBT 40288]|nr:hypothetical protein S40288_08561 [Stachybotrys chartarum IBT 40288]